MALVIETCEWSELLWMKFNKTNVNYVNIKSTGKWLFSRKKWKHDKGLKSWILEC